MLVLGIESSCDETGVALYDTNLGLIGNQLHTQIAMHAQYGGVVPELASRDHIRRLVPLTQACLAEAGKSYADIDAIAFTQGPGLSGALLAGTSFANALAFALGKPVLPVHHLEGHLLSPLLADIQPEFPFVALLVSGGHSQLMSVRGIGDYTLLGESVDDAAGEAFDKTAKLLGLPYPGGAQLSELAKLGTPDVYNFPRPMLHSHDLQMSFSGLKTAVLTAVQKVRQQTGCHDLPESTRNDICRAFQDAVIEVLVAKSKQALLDTGFRTLVVAGGVGANWKLRQELNNLSVRQSVPKHQVKPPAEAIQVFFPPLSLCTDNGAMIAFAGMQRLKAGHTTGLEIVVQPRWNLETLAPVTF